MKVRGSNKDGDHSSKDKKSAWALFLTVHAVVVSRIEQRLRAAHLPELAWYDVLWALERAPENRLRMHELAEMTVISRSNLTRLVDRLEAAGLVTRDRDCADRRGAYAVLTAAGRAKRQKIWPVYSMAIESLFDAYMSAAESVVMRKALMRVLQPIRAKVVDANKSTERARRNDYRRG